MTTAFDRFNLYKKQNYTALDTLKKHFLTTYPVHYTDNPIDESVAKRYDADYVWIVDKNIDVLENFPWHFSPNQHEPVARHVFPYVFKGSKRIISWSKVKLVPTKVEPKETVQHKHIAAKYDAKKGKTHFDVFYIGEHSTILDKIPDAIQVSSFEEAKSLAHTDMFYLVPEDVEIGKYFKFNFTPDDWSTKVVHVFGNGSPNSFDGIALFPTAYDPNAKELQHRFYVNKKEVKIQASTPKLYPSYTFKNYDEYIETLEKETSDIFWYIPDDINLEKELDLYFTHHNQYDRRTNHVFLNGQDYDGVMLLSKHSPITRKEFEHRFLASKKEHNEVYSTPKKYQQFCINNYDDYKKACVYSKTDMFWGVPSDVEVAEDFDFEIYFSHHNRYDRTITHVFANGKTYDGVVLFSKNALVSEKEVNYRFYADKKEWNIVASHPRIYPVHEIETYDQYLQVIDQEDSDLFWMSSPNISMMTSVYDVYISHHDRNLRMQNHVFLHQNNVGVSFNGMILCSKHKLLTKNEVEYRHPVERIEHSHVLSKNKIYDRFYIETYDDYLKALDDSKTEMFWMNTPNINTEHFNFNFTFDFDNKYDRHTNHAFQHVVDNQISYNGLFLCSKHKPLTQKEVEYRHIVDVKEWDEVGSYDISYDRFCIETYDDYLMALENSETELFWGYTENIDTRDFDFDLYFTHDNQYDRKNNHSFIHLVNGKELRNGLFLYSKHKPVTQKEIEFRHIVNAKEWPIIASRPVQYERFIINNYADYLHALDTVRTEMFWGIPSDVEVDINFEFREYFTHDNEYDRKTNHVFLNDEYYDGIVLFSAHTPVTQKEIESRFYVNKKEHAVVASVPKQYDKFIIETYNDYLNALEQSKTDMFWATTHNIKILEDFNFNLYFSHHNSYDRNINHAFVHKVNDEKHYNGLFLFSKSAVLTQKEIEHRLVATRKEWDIVASGPVQYDKFKVKTYKDYQHALEKSKTEMFWIIPNNVKVNKDFSFDLYFTHNQYFERNTNHSFKNGTAWDGISLVSKNSLITEKEIDMCFLADKKQYDIVASTPDQYDIVFISYNETDADKNYDNLLKRYPHAKRVHGVKGIHNAHIEAAKLCNSEMFFVVDADAEIIDNFEFDYYVPQYDPTGKQSVHVWKSQNPINGLIYGYGGVKLLPTQMTIDMDTSMPDMTTSISKYFKPVNRISNITKFNTDAFSTWRSAFRECVKLSSKTIKGQLDEETEFRLNAWCSRGKDKPFGDAAISGAIHGKKYGEYAANNLEALNKINDFEWLEQQFKQHFE